MSAQSAGLTEAHQWKHLHHLTSGPSSSLKQALAGKGGGRFVVIATIGTDSNADA